VARTSDSGSRLSPGTAETFRDNAQKEVASLEKEVGVPTASIVAGLMSAIELRRRKLAKLSRPKKVEK